MTNIYSLIGTVIGLVTGGAISLACIALWEEKRRFEFAFLLGSMLVLCAFGLFVSAMKVQP